MARGDPGPHAGADPGSRPRDDRGVEVDGHSGLVAPRECLHRGGVHEGREAHVRPGGQDPRPIAPLQFQLGRQHAKGDRHPRRGGGRRGRVQGAREGRGGPEWPAGEETVDPEVQFRAAARGACRTPRRGWWSGCCPRRRTGSGCSPWHRRRSTTSGRFIVRAFNRASEADKWFGDNPAELVKPRKVPDPHHDILTPEEVVPFFTALAPKERPIPIIAETKGAAAIASGGIGIDDPRIPLRTKQAQAPRTTPSTPPNTVSITASPRNCICTAASVAPTARRIPISRVRSVTETS